MYCFFRQNQHIITKKTDYVKYRGSGIGRKIMRSLPELLGTVGYKRASLAVQKDNYAVKMYKNVGFEIVGENEQEYIMLCELCKQGE